MHDDIVIARYSLTVLKSQQKLVEIRLFGFLLRFGTES